MLLKNSTEPISRNDEPRMGMIEGTLGKVVTPNNNSPTGAQIAPIMPLIRWVSGGAPIACPRHSFVVASDHNLDANSQKLVEANASEGESGLQSGIVCQ